MLRKLWWRSPSRCHAAREFITLALLCPVLHQTSASFSLTITFGMESLTSNRISICSGRSTKPAKTGEFAAGRLVVENAEIIGCQSGH